MAVNYREREVDAQTVVAAVHGAAVALSQSVPMSRWRRGPGYGGPRRGRVGQVDILVNNAGMASSAAWTI